MPKNTLRRWRVPLLAGVISLGASLGSVVAWSLWSTSASGDPVSATTGLVNGDFDGANSDWRRSTPGFTELYGSTYVQPCGPITGDGSAPIEPEGDDSNDPQLCATPVDPATITTMPGDSFEFLMPITASVAGNNMAAGFSVSIASNQAATWVDATQSWDSSTGNLALEYYVADPTTLEQVAPAVGEPLAKANQVVTLPNLVPGADTLTTPYVVVARVTVLGDYGWATSIAGITAAQPAIQPGATTTTPAGPGPAGWNVGTLAFNLMQVRGGGN